jgi:DNA-binding winged helix-turn-helix (wHTH) protein
LKDFGKISVRIRRRTCENQREFEKSAAMFNRSGNRFYDFMNFRVDETDRLLLRDGEIVQLTPKVFDILLLLIQNNGHVLTKDEMISAVWPESFVEESNLARNISTLRQALGGRHYIVTVPRRGYRFAASVHESWRVSRQDSAARRSAGAAIRAGIRSLAVLPFQPLIAEECDARLGLRIADAVITRLSAFGKLIVSPTSAVRRYAGLEQDLLAAGSELKVDAALGGSLQQSHEVVRVTAQLLNVGDGTSLWGAQFDARFTDVFEVEDSLSTQLIDALAGRLIGGEDGVDAGLALAEDHGPSHG